MALITGEQGGISQETEASDARFGSRAHPIDFRAAYGDHGRERSGLADVSPLWRAVHKGWGLVAGAAFTTLVASTAIAPFAVFHFHRMTEYGLIANLLAAPIVSLLIMPMALLALTAMPFGLEAWPLKAMGLGITMMVGIGKWVAGWPGALTVLPQISGTALVLIVLGGLWLCLWQTRTRALGLVIAALGLALAPPSTRPDVLIDRDGETAALRSEGGSSFFHQRPRRATASTTGCSLTAMPATQALLPQAMTLRALSNGSPWLYRHGEGESRGADPPPSRARGGLPYGRHRHCPVHREQEM